MVGIGTANPQTPTVNQNGSVNPLAQTYRALNAVANPMASLQSMFSQTQIGQAMDVVRQNGGNAKQAFYNLARQKGVDPNSILNQLR